MIVDTYPQSLGLLAEQAPPNLFFCKRSCNRTEVVAKKGRSQAVRGRGSQERRARGRLLSGASIWIAQARHDCTFIRHAGILSQPELQEAKAHKQDLQRRRTIVGKILLRLALSQTVDNIIAPAQWRISRDDLGKPRLAPGSLPLTFSISHNETTTVVAVSYGVDVGVDIEASDQAIAPNVVRDFLTASEHAAWKLRDNNSQRETAIRLWTLKEAYTKMIGAGLSLDFSNIDLELLNHSPETSAHPNTALQGWTVGFADGVRCQLALALGVEQVASQTNIFTIGSQGQALLF
jgi:phosphopantetheinyl transferase